MDSPSKRFASIGVFWQDIQPKPRPTYGNGRLILPRPSPESVRSLLIPFQDFKPTGSVHRLVKGVLGHGGLSAVYGQPGAGKSFLALDIAVAVATGAAWMGHPTTQGPVIYAAGEGVEGLRQRRTAVAKVRNLTEPQLAFVPRALSVREEVETFLLLFDRAAELYWIPPVLLILDTLNRFFGDGDENTARDMTVFLRAVDLLRGRHPRLHVMIVHHAGKDESKGMRGSSALKGASDTVIFCEKANGQHAAVVEKQKDGEEGLAFPFVLKPVEVGLDEDGSPITSCVVEPADPVATTGPFLSESQRLAVRILCDLGSKPKDGGLMNHTVEYEAYRARYCEANGNDHDRSVRQAAGRAITDLRDRHHAVEWAGATGPITLLEKLWQLNITK